VHKGVHGEKPAKGEEVSHIKPAWSSSLKVKSANWHGRPERVDHVRPNVFQFAKHKRKRRLNTIKCTGKKKKKSNAKGENEMRARLT